LKKNTRSPNDVPYEPLTDREKEILRLISGGSSNRKIAESLFIAHSTVRWYIRQIYNKLGVETRAQAIQLAINLGLHHAEEPIRLNIDHNLPTEIDTFIGRERELNDLINLITKPDIRLITVLGAGGMGKTRLVLAFARQMITIQNDHIEQGKDIQFPHGVYFVPFISSRSLEHVISTIAENTSFRFQQDGRQIKQQLFDYFHDKYLLLILDNFEYFLDEKEFINEILEVAPYLKIIVTSRDRLDLYRETVYNIGGMGFPDTAFLEKSLEYDAVQLFLQSAQRIKTNFELDLPQMSNLAHICQLVEGMPLGIVLAATWVEVLTLSEIASEISNSVDFLSTDMHDIPMRQRSIRAIFEYSWKRLESQNQEVLLKLAVFKGGCTRKAAEVVGEANLAILQALVKRSLIGLNSDQRYEIHELLRQFLEEKLNATGNAITVRMKHSSYFADRLYQLKHQLRGKQQVESLNIIEQDIENIRIGWHHAIEYKQFDVIEEYLESLYYFYNVRSRAIEGLEMISLITSVLLQHQFIEKLNILLAKVLARQGSLTHRLGQYQIAKQLLVTSLQILEKSDIREEIAFVLNNLADIERATGNYESARKLCTRSLAIFRELDDRWSIAGTLNNLGVVLYYLEDFPQAYQYYIESLSISKRLDDQNGIATSLVNLGAVAHDLENYEEAQQYYLESLEFCENLDDRDGVAASLINLGRTFFMLGSYEEAYQYCEEGLKLSKTLGNQWGVAASLINMGDINCYNGDLRQARYCFTQALDTAQNIQATPLLLEVVISIANLLAIEGQTELVFEILLVTSDEVIRDKETRERKANLWSYIRVKLPNDVIASIQENQRFDSITALVEHMFAIL